MASHHQRFAALEAVLNEEGRRLRDNYTRTYDSITGMKKQRESLVAFTSKMKQEVRDAEEALAKAKSAYDHAMERKPGQPPLEAMQAVLLANKEVISTKDRHYFAQRLVDSGQQHLAIWDVAIEKTMMHLEACTGVKRPDSAPMSTILLHSPAPYFTPTKGTKRGRDGNALEAHSTRSSPRRVPSQSPSTTAPVGEGDDMLEEVQLVNTDNEECEEEETQLIGEEDEKQAEEQQGEEQQGEEQQGEEQGEEQEEDHEQELEEDDQEDREEREELKMLKDQGGEDGEGVEGTDNKQASAFVQDLDDTHTPTKCLGYVLYDGQKPPWCFGCPDNDHDQLCGFCKSHVKKYACM